MHFGFNTSASGKPVPRRDYGRSPSVSKLSRTMGTLMTRPTLKMKTFVMEMILQVTPSWVRACESDDDFFEALTADMADYMDDGRDLTNAFVQRRKRARESCPASHLARRKGQARKAPRTSTRTTMLHQQPLPPRTTSSFTIRLNRLMKLRFTWRPHLHG